jgi:ABC-type antimicrobial peptide transport system ATPase subunit
MTALLEARNISKVFDAGGGIFRRRKTVAVL